MTKIVSEFEEPEEDEIRRLNKEFRQVERLVNLLGFQLEREGVRVKPGMKYTLVEPGCPLAELANVPLHVVREYLDKFDKGMIPTRWTERWADDDDDAA